jgi:hypothetical protein
MTDRKKGYPGFIDPPSPFDPLGEWEAFAREIEPAALEWEGAQRELDQARRIIAERKARGEIA